jgi:hypothetical protein
MKKPNTIEDEIDRIRLNLYEETKHMSTEEYLEYFRRYSELAEKKYGFTIVKSLDSKDDETHK